MYNYTNQNDRYFLVPFLLGGLAGGAIGAYSKPRPVYVTSLTPYQSYPQGPYGNYSYSYYYPYPR